MVTEAFTGGGKSGWRASTCDKWWARKRAPLFHFHSTPNANPNPPPPKKAIWNDACTLFVSVWRLFVLLPFEVQACMF